MWSQFECVPHHSWYKWNNLLNYHHGCHLQPVPWTSVVAQASFLIECSNVDGLKLLIIFKQEAPHFNFALGTQIMYPGLLPHAYVAPLCKLDPCEHKVWPGNSTYVPRKTSSLLRCLQPHSRVHMHPLPWLRALTQHTASSAGLDSHMLQECSYRSISAWKRGWTLGGVE